ncbi:glycosyltransferase family 4 protein [Alicyclobacillus fodiniaquatilis]|uniref:Glycosyltransferase family 4 protein n=1 Tax=Alicyclobacillus fodiniaquatilis TaxID=1661150 RepID=A0ABW4JCK6_9BACL
MKLGIVSDTNPNARDGAQIYGATFAENTWLEALLRYWDDTLIILTSDQNDQAIRAYIHQVSITKQVQCNVTVRHISELPLLDGDLDVLYDPNGMRVKALSEVRRTFTKQFQLVCAYHTLSYNHLRPLWSDWCSTDWRDGDAILGSSSTSIHALQHLLSDNAGNVFNHPQVYHCPLAVNLNNFNLVERLRARKLLGLPTATGIVTFLGRLSPYDKTDLTVPMIGLKKLLMDRDVLLLVVGDDYYKYSSAIRRTASQLGLDDKVLIIPNAGMWDRSLFYSASDVVLCLSDSVQESFGLTPLEAMASGCVVVTSEWDGYKETVIPEQTGLFVPTYTIQSEKYGPWANLVPWQIHHLQMAQQVAIDLEQLSLAVERGLYDEELRRKCLGHGPKHVMQHYTQEAWVHRFRTIISKEAIPVSWPSNCQFKDPFHGYPSRIIQPDNRLTSQSYAGNILNIVYQGIPNLTRILQYKDILSALEEVSLVQSISWEDCVFSLKMKQIKNPQSALLFLLKHGFISLQE